MHGSPLLGPNYEESESDEHSDQDEDDDDGDTIVIPSH